MFGRLTTTFETNSNWISRLTGSTRLYFALIPSTWFVDHTTTTLPLQPPLSTETCSGFRREGRQSSTLNYCGILQVITWSIKFRRHANNYSETVRNEVMIVNSKLLSAKPQLQRIIASFTADLHTPRTIIGNRSPITPQHHRPKLSAVRAHCSLVLWMVLYQV